MFFLLSGYFLFHSNPYNLYIKARKSASKIFWLTLALNCIYFACLYPLYGNPLDSPYLILKHIILGREIMPVLWFMTDLLTGMLLIMLIYRFCLDRFLPISLIIIPMQVLMTMYYPILGLDDNLAPTVQNIYHLLPMSLPYFYIGFLVKKHQSILTQQGSLWFALFLALCVTSYIEQWATTTYLHNNITLEYLSTAPLCVSLLILMLQRPNLGRGSVLEQIGKEHSARIYYFHMLFVVGLPLLLDRMGYSLGYYKLGVLWVFPLSLLLSRFIGYIQNKLGIRFF